MKHPPPAPSPPRIARALLRRLAASPAIEALEGDLAELFTSRVGSNGVRRARWQYRRDVVSILVRPQVWMTSEADRPVRGENPIMSVIDELRHAVRSLRRRPAFVMTTILVLTLGIGATTAALSVLNAYLLRPLPVPEPDRLLSIVTPPFNAVRPPAGWETVDWRHEFGDLFEHIIASESDAFTVVGEPHPEMLLGAWVTPDYFAAGGVRPAIGRTLTPADSRPGAGRVAMISHRVWQTRFGGDPQVVGRGFTTYAMNRPRESEIFTIVGVLPPEFWFFASRFTDVLAPLQAGPRVPTLVTLRPGVTLSDAERVMSSAVSRFPSADARYRVTLTPAAERHVEQIRPTLAAIAAAVAMVLLVTIANVAMLLLLRATDREREVAIRTALGARRGRLARHLMAEGFLLTLGGCALGLVLASVALDGLGVSIQQQLRTEVPGGAAALRVDFAVFAQVAGLALLIAVILGLVPMAATSGSRTLTDIQGGRTMTMSRGRRRLRSALVGAELAMSLALIIGAALLVQSALHLNQIPIGFDADNVMKTEVMLSIRTYRTPSERADAIDRLLAGIRAVPGVANASAVFPSPFRSIRAMQWDVEEQPQPLEAAELIVGDQYFETLNIALRRGRLFAPRDLSGAPRVAIVSDALAARAWPGADPIGRRLRRRPTGQAQTPADWLTVVGVVAETRQTLTATDPVDVYVPFAQQPMRGGTLLVRSAQRTMPPLPTLRAAVAGVDPELALAEPDLLANVVAASTSTQRFLTVLIGGFAVSASLLAVVGVYGVIAFGLARRERDIAVHLCFGASRATVVRMLARQEGVMVCSGLAAGIACAAALARTVGGQLYGIQAGDLTTYAGSATSLGLVASIAIVGPAVRAAGLDLMGVLRRDVT